MPRQTRLDARYLSTLPAARGQDRLHRGDGVMTHLGPIGGLGRYTATHSEHIAAAGPELQMIQANPSYRFTASRRTAPGSHKHGSGHSHSLLALKPVKLISPHLTTQTCGRWRSSRTSDSRGGSHQRTTTEEVYP